MNIFVLHLDPKTAAEQHCDKHVGKMLLETVQMLSTARQRHGLDAPYREVHTKHPCTIWAGDSVQNFKWLYQLGLSLDDQFKKRFGKQHKSGLALRECADGLDALPDNGLTQRPQAMPVEYKNDDPVTAYRKYYLAEKARFAKWERGVPSPSWWPGNTPKYVPQKQDTCDETGHLRP